MLIPRGTTQKFWPKLLFSLLCRSVDKIPDGDGLKIRIGFKYWWTDSIRFSSPVRVPIRKCRVYSAACGCFSISTAIPHCKSWFCFDFSLSNFHFLVSFFLFPFFFFRFLLLLSAPSMRMFLSFFSRSPGSVLFLLKWNRRTGKALWSQDNRFRNSGQPWPHPVEFTSIVKP